MTRNKRKIDKERTSEVKKEKVSSMGMKRYIDHPGLAEFAYKHAVLIQTIWPLTLGMIAYILLTFLIPEQATNSFLGKEFKTIDAAGAFLFLVFGSWAFSRATRMAEYKMAFERGDIKFSAEDTKRIFREFLAELDKRKKQHPK